MGQAHPSRLHAITWHGGTPTLRYLTLDAAGGLTHSTDIPVADGPLVHDMALTATRVVVLDLPVTLSKEVASHAATAAPQSAGRFPPRWNDDHSSRVGVLPRGANAEQIRWFDAPTCFVFHVLNSFDNVDGSITVDVVVTTPCSATRCAPRLTTCQPWRDGSSTRPAAPSRNRS